MRAQHSTLCTTAILVVLLVTTDAASTVTFQQPDAGSRGESNSANRWPQVTANGMSREGEDATIYGRLTPAHYPGLFRYWSRVTNQTTGIAGVTLPFPQHRVFTDCRPIPFPAPSGQDAVICAVAKNGSSRWKTLFYRSLVPDFAEHKKWFGVHTDAVPWLVPLSRGEMVHWASSPSALRFMWVRNPYSRLLSAFLDKGVNTPGEKSWQDKVKRLGGPYYDSPQEFHRFLRNIVDVWEEGEALDYHFNPQSRLCGLPQGVRYDFYLKVEDMAVWFADLVSLLGLEDAVATGWGADYKKSLDSSVPSCFFPLPGTSCNLTDTILRQHGRSVHPEGLHHHHHHYWDPEASHHPLQTHEESPSSAGQLQSWMATKTSGHAHNVDAHLRRYYASEDAILLATRFVQADLDTFGYPPMEHVEPVLSEIRM